MIGRIYIERGQPVVVLVRASFKRGAGPRNVLIRRADGTLVVRPFRGLRTARCHVERPHDSAPTDPAPTASHWQ